MRLPRVEDIINRMNENIPENIAFRISADLKAVGVRYDLLLF